MLKLTDIKKIKKFDPQNMLSSLELLGKQVEEIYFQYGKIKIDQGLKKINKIVVIGMGGSGLGVHFIKTLYKDEIKLPIEIVNDYNLPGYVDTETLVVLCSYSGNTEEILQAAKQAVEKKTKIFIITSGGELAKMAKVKKLPGIIFSTENNPSAMPRVGVGYMITAFNILLSGLGILSLNKNKISEVIGVLDQAIARFGIFNETSNVSKKLAGEIKERSVWVVGAEHLSGVAHITANQINETAKRFGGYFLIPELNHHLLEGLFFPKSNKKDILFLFLNSKNYSDKIKKRFEITKKILKKNQISYLDYESEEKDKVSEAYETLVFGGFLNFYSAMLKEVNPSVVPFVDYLKKELKK